MNIGEKKKRVRGKKRIEPSIPVTLPEKTPIPVEIPEKVSVPQKTG